MKNKNIVPPLQKKPALVYSQDAVKLLVTDKLAAYKNKPEPLQWAIIGEAMDVANYCIKHQADNSIFLNHPQVLCELFIETISAKPGYLKHIFDRQYDFITSNMHKDNKIEYKRLSAVEKMDLQTQKRMALVNAASEWAARKLMRSYDTTVSQEALQEKIREIQLSPQATAEAIKNLKNYVRQCIDEYGIVKDKTFELDHKRSIDITIEKIHAKFSKKIEETRAANEQDSPQL